MGGGPAMCDVAYALSLIADALQNGEYEDSVGAVTDVETVASLSPTVLPSELPSDIPTSFPGGPCVDLVPSDFEFVVNLPGGEYDFFTCAEISEAGYCDKEVFVVNNDPENSVGIASDICIRSCNGCGLPSSFPSLEPSYLPSTLPSLVPSPATPPPPQPRAVTGEVVPLTSLSNPMAVEGALLTRTEEILGIDSDRLRRNLQTQVTSGCEVNTQALPKPCSSSFPVDQITDVVTCYEFNIIISEGSGGTATCDVSFALNLVADALQNGEYEDSVGAVTDVEIVVPCVDLVPSDFEFVVNLPGGDFDSLTCEEISEAGYCGSEVFVISNDPANSVGEASFICIRSCNRCTPTAPVPSASPSISIVPSTVPSLVPSQPPRFVTGEVAPVSLSDPEEVEEALLTRTEEILGIYSDSLRRILQTQITSGCVVNTQALPTPCSSNFPPDQITDVDSCYVFNILITEGSGGPATCDVAYALSLVSDALENEEYEDAVGAVTDVETVASLSPTDSPSESPSVLPSSFPTTSTVPSSVPSIVPSSEPSPEPWLEDLLMIRKLMKPSLPEQKNY